jgi:hypothetical protein
MVVVYVRTFFSLFWCDYCLWIPLFIWFFFFLFCLISVWLLFRYFVDCVVFFSYLGKLHVPTTYILTSFPLSNEILTAFFYVTILPSFLRYTFQLSSLLSSQGWVYIKIHCLHGVLERGLVICTFAVLMWLKLLVNCGLTWVCSFPVVSVNDLAFSLFTQVILYRQVSTYFSNLSAGQCARPRRFSHLHRSASSEDRLLKFWAYI